jgi:hypothetical protein
MRELRLRAEELELAARRVALLEEKASQAKAAEQAAQSRRLTPEEREQRLKEIFDLS